jgi:hypothetical protein
MDSANCFVVTEKVIAGVLHTCDTWDKSGEESASQQFSVLQGLGPNL